MVFWDYIPTQLAEYILLPTLCKTLNNQLILLWIYSYALVPTPLAPPHLAFQLQSERQQLRLKISSVVWRDPTCPWCPLVGMNIIYINFVYKKHLYIYFEVWPLQDCKTSAHGPVDRKIPSWRNGRTMLGKWSARTWHFPFPTLRTYFCDFPTCSTTVISANSPLASW